MIRNLGWASFILAFGVLSAGCVEQGPEDIDSEDDDIAQHAAACKGGGGGGKGKKKIEICHVPPGNPDNAHTIKVSKSSVDAHLGHGDYLGKCDDNAGGDDDDDDDDPNGGSGGSGSGGSGSGGSGSGGSGAGGGGGDPVCSTDGALCSAGAECCSGVCGGSGICTATCNPISDGPESKCSPSHDCCPGAACIQGLCYAGFTCKQAAASCNPDPESGDWCCFGLVCLANADGTGSCLSW